MESHMFEKMKRRSCNVYLCNTSHTSLMGLTVNLIIPHPEKRGKDTVPLSIYMAYGPCIFWHLLLISHLLTITIINSTVRCYNTSEKNKHLERERERERERGRGRDASTWAFSSQQLQLKLTTI